jgi:hypothetical protein
MATLLQAAQVYPEPRSLKKRSRDQKRQFTTSPQPPAGIAFLNHRFAPLIDRNWPFRNQQDAVEQIFFTGLQNLCSFYQLPVPDVAAIAYPYSIFYAHQQTSAALKERHPDVQLHLLQDDEGSLHVGCVKTFETDHRLYFIPVKPLFDLLYRKKATATAQLIISLMAWLNKIVDIPFFTEPSCYVSYTYECIENMLNDAEDEYEEAEYHEYLEEMEYIKAKGEKVMKLISHPAALSEMETRITTYEPNTLLESVLAQVGKQALALRQAFPNRSYLDQIIELDDEERDCQTIVQVDKYLSFHWSWEGYAGEQLHEFVKCDTMEAIETEEPKAVQLFDNPQDKETHDFRFEEKLFDILDSFIYVLNNLS